MLAGIAAAAEAAKGMDVAIVVLGETNILCSEAHGRTSLNLPGYQEELLEAIQATGTPVVLVLSNGRPLSVNWAARHVPAILEMWFPGDQGGDAIADVLFGDVNPSGRLPITFPKTVGQILFNFPAKPGSQDHDIGMVDGALFPFGFGLSYTTYAFGNLRISPERQGTQGQRRGRLRCDHSGFLRAWRRGGAALPARRLQQRDHRRQAAARLSPGCTWRRARRAPHTLSSPRKTSPSTTPITSWTVELPAASP